jgi:MFS family permease
MKPIGFSTHILPHIVAVAVFLVITLFFFSPVFFGSKTLQQYDIQQFTGSSKSIADYRKAMGEEALWADNMFSGMPAFMVSVQWGNAAVGFLKNIMSLFLPHPISNIFVSFICYYIMLLCFRIRPYLANPGAIAIGLSSYMIIGLAAGHNGRIGAIAFLPMIMAGIQLAFRGKHIAGMGVTAAGMALHLRENHVQMTYYFLLIVFIYGLIQLLEAVKEKTLPALAKTLAVLIVAVILGAGTFFGQFWAIKEYSAYSTRGKSDLTAATGQQDNPDASGMSKEYAFEFSNGILEPFTLMIPNMYGGSSGNFLFLDRNSEVYNALVRSGDQKTANQLAGYTGAYWGDQRMASPYYAGAIIVFLFVLGIAFAEKKWVWWLGSVSILGIVLSWGSNFSAFNYFMFDYFPGYGNFRSGTFTLMMILFAMPLLGLLGLENLWRHGVDKKAKRKLLIVFASTGGLCLLFWLSAGMFSFTREAEAQLPAWFVDALADDRKSLFRSDAIRSFFFILIAFTVIYFDLHKNFSAFGFYAFLIFVVTVDLSVVDKRYFTDDHFKRKSDNSFFAATEADQEILKDKSYYRVYNLSYLTGKGESPFAEARTSYFHHSIGGYHGAKLRRYAEFYDSCVVRQTQQFVDQANKGNATFDDLHAFNMLNIKYIVIGTQRRDLLNNPSAYGNAWFVRDIVKVQSATEELKKTCFANTSTSAVVNVSEFSVEDVGSDTTASITLTAHTPRNLSYSSSSVSNGVAIFSEIYYPGWKATIDGKETNILRADYILRALQVPAGKHTIVFTFEPPAYTVGNKITTASSWLVLLLFIGSMVWSFRQRHAPELYGSGPDA